MVKENDYVKQREAPRAFGTHFVQNESYKKYSPASKFFFEHSLPKNLKTSPQILDASCGNEARVMEGLTEYAKNTPYQVELTASDIVFPSNMSKLPENIKRTIIQADLKQRWLFPDNNFDGVIFTWALHWFGLEGSQNALDNLFRVLKPGSSALISTLTPYDSAIKNHVFLKNKTKYVTAPDETRVAINIPNISKKALKKLYPDAKIFGGHDQDNNPTWVVRRGENYVNEQIKSNGGYFLKQSHPQSNLGGDKTMIGFTAEYLRKELIRRGFEIVTGINQTNKNFPNYTSLGKRFQPTMPEGRSQLIYIVKKNNNSIDN